MKYLKPLAFLPLLLALSACENVKQQVTDAYYNIADMGIPAINGEAKGKALSDRLVEKGSCPVVEITDDLGSFYDFGGARPGADTLISRALMSQQSACSYGPKSVTVDVRVNFDGVIGPAGRQQTGDQPGFSYPYFVAIVAPGGKILAKDVFAVSMTYQPGMDRQSRVESIRQIIPIYNQEYGASHKVVIGFQLTKDQLAYNRSLIARRDHEAAVQKIHDRKIEELRQERMRQDRLRQQALQPAEATTLPPQQEMPAPADDNAPIILAPQDDANGKMNQ